MTKIVAVIDGNSLMHRAYHAIQTPMMAPDKTPTNAVFGFMQMFCKFIETANPDAVICAFDVGKPEQRIADLPQYKAQRPHMDDELRVQFPVIESLLNAMNVPVVKVPGWEGDDILGTIAKRDEALGYETLLVTGDKDACQLASELTKIVTTKKGISEVSILGPDEVMEKYGVSPDQFTDYLGLMGDSSDNIPGVAGIGPKSATKLLETYGNIEGIYEHIDELKGKQKENLIENEELAYLSRQIATIITDLDFPLDIEQVSFPSFEKDDVEEAFKKYALSSPLTRVLRLIGTSTQREVIKIDFEPIEQDADIAAKMVDEAIAKHQSVGVAFSYAEQETIFGRELTVVVSTDDGCAAFNRSSSVQVLKQIFEQTKFATFDLKQYIQVLFPPDTCEEALIDADVLFSSEGFDVHLAGYDLLSTASSYTVEDLVNRYLESDLPEGKSEIENLAIQACACRLLENKLRDELAKENAERTYFEIDLLLVPVLAIMERDGVNINSDRLYSLGETTQIELRDLSQKIFDLAGESFNIDSPKQLSHILFEVMGLTPIKKNSRGYSTDASVLTELAKTEEIASLVLKYRELSKIKSTYIDALPKMRAADKLLHTKFHETVTATGRLSSSDPNLQNIPVRSDFGRQIRECFIPLAENSVFMSADYSQIELRLLAHLSGDEHLIDAFNSGADFHAQTASRVFDIPIDEVDSTLRSRAKAVNFGIVYGQQAYGLSQSLGIDFGEAKDMIDRYFAAYPSVRNYLDGIVESASKTGYADTIYGRRRYIPELHASNARNRGFGERTAMNHPMQGSAADIIKIAMIEVEKRLREGGFKSKLLLQVHDELDLSVLNNEIDDVSKLVKDAMENVIELSVPLVVDIGVGENWAQAH